MESRQGILVYSTLIDQKVDSKSPMVIKRREENNDGHIFLTLREKNRIVQYEGTYALMVSAKQLSRRLAGCKIN